MSDDIPEPDRIEGAPHPRNTHHLIGQTGADAEFLRAFNGGRLHHGWLMTGPRGVGKATLAWRIARFLLATPENDGGMFAPPPPDSLDIPDSHPVARRLSRHVGKLGRAFFALENVSLTVEPGESLGSQLRRTAPRGSTSFSWLGTGTVATG